ncbi:MAG: hypothetical protein K0S65_6097, partial [Labilithrix sp.]|nr:hypothetical protein [Labilithrix sp.]
MNEDLFHRSSVRPRRGYAVVVIAAAAATLFAASCSVSEKTAFIVGNDIPDGSTSSGFITPPEAEAGSDGRAPLVEYCPSDRCPEGYTTCANSLFRCDIDLKSDRDNCGACGAGCPPNNGRETFECVEGRCALGCNPRTGSDCDGIVDNGCETPPSDPNHCGVCGNACTDPAKPCMFWDNLWNCGCPAGYLVCPFFGTTLTCIEVASNDANCGACKNACSPNGDGGTAPDNAYFGCVGGECGHLKCKAPFANCDGDMEDGCETNLTTNENCGTCGNACPTGQTCQRDPDNNYVCMCPPPLTACAGRCVDLGT